MNIRMSGKSIYIAALWVAIAVIVTAVYIATSSILEQQRIDDGIAPSSTASVTFIEMCSGYDMSNSDTQMIAVAECTGRVRGFIDGSKFAYIASREMSGRSISLWCTPGDITAVVVLDSIMDWVDRNPQEFSKIVQDVGPEHAPTVVMVRALRGLYPCRSM